VSDEGDIADDAASDGGDTEGSRDNGGRTAVVTSPRRGRNARPESGPGSEWQIPTKTSKATSRQTTLRFPRRTRPLRKSRKARNPRKPRSRKKSGDRSANPFLFIYNYLKQVVAEMRKVIWPNRKQMLTYTSVVLDSWPSWWRWSASPILA